MIIYFVRHGKTIFGEDDRLEGINDSILSNNGVNHAEKIGNFLKNRNISKVVSSPLKRSKQTAEIIAEIINAEIDVDPIWKEMSYGIWDGIKKNKLRKLPEWQDREQSKYFFVHPSNSRIHGESYDILYNRLKPKLEELSKSSLNSNFLIVAHCGILRCVRKFFDNLTPEETVDYSPPHDEVLILDKKNNKIRLRIKKIL